MGFAAAGIKGGDGCTMTPAVSVIVPCHNGGRFLDGLIANLAAQTFRDFEIVVVNNGSTEPATLATLAALASTVRVIDQENRYLPGARNRGFQEARAEFVLPLDCDDRLEPSFIAETFSILGAAPDDAGFVYTHMRFAGSLIGVYASCFEFFDQLFMNHLPYCMLIRKSAWTAVRGYNENMQDGSEDWDFNIRLAEAGYRGIEIAKPLFIYAVRPDGMLLSKSARMQGTIWRQIRSGHDSLYRLSALVALWRLTNRRWSSAIRAAVLLSTARVLPESWFNVLYFQLIKLVRRWRMMRGRLSAAQLSAQ
jgi:glycosyltransferase involved in cell wall biosynthesis